MAKSFACALTHVRHESFFLEKWIAYYGGIVGRENLYVVIDGDDWTVDVDLSGITVEIILEAPRRRIQNDRWIAKEMSRRANALRKRYSHVIRGDVDEYVTIDPASGLDWPEALEELGEQGYIYALGVDMVQSEAETAPIDRAAPILGQRRQGFVSDRYSKPFVISRWNNWTGGAHRLINREVKLSQHFVLFHMALADKAIAQERMLARGGTAQHVSFVDHQQARLEVIGAAKGLHRFDYAEACAIGQAQFAVEPDGTPASRPRAAVVEGVDERGLYVTLPDRFFGLV
jgi:hypothetical protein